MPLTPLAMISLRPLRAADAEAVRETALEAWLATYRAIYEESFIRAFVRTHYARDRLRALAAKIESGEAFFHVALDGDAVVGFCHIGTRDGEAELHRIYLRPVYVGRGIGAALLDAGETWLRKRGVSAYRCFVHRDNEVGKRFYRHQGFVRRPERDHDHEWCMEKTLNATQSEEAAETAPVGRAGSPERNPSARDGGQVE